MVPFGKSVPQQACHHVGVLWRRGYHPGTNFNLAVWCRYRYTPRRGFIEEKGGRRASWHSRCEGERVQVFLPQKPKYQRSCDNITAPVHLDYYQKKTDSGSVLMFIVTTLVIGYTHLDDVGVHEHTLESTRERLLCELRKDPPQVKEDGRAVQGGYLDGRHF